MVETVKRYMPPELRALGSAWLELQAANDDAYLDDGSEFDGDDFASIDLDDDDHNAAHDQSLEFRRHVQTAGRFTRQGLHVMAERHREDARALFPEVLAYVNADERERKATLAWVACSYGQTAEDVDAGFLDESWLDDDEDAPCGDCYHCKGDEPVFPNS